MKVFHPDRSVLGMWSEPETGEPPFGIGAIGVAPDGSVYAADPRMDGFKSFGSSSSRTARAR